MKLYFKSIVIPRVSLLQIVYVLCCFAVFFWVISLNRNLIYDNQNYINYFEGHNVRSFLENFHFTSSWLYKILSLFSGEYLWLVYTDLLSYFLLPAQCILFTVFLMQLLLFTSFYKLKWPLIALLLWVLLPAGLATIGVAQIRQGFAFSIFLFFAIIFDRPLLGAVIAAMFHTTFFIVLVLIGCFLVFKKRKRLFVSSVILVSIVASIFGNAHFHEIAGRRSFEYTIDEGANKINFVIGVILFMIPTVVTMYFKKKEDAILLVHLGICIWLIIAFVFFPLGTSRIGYYETLFMIPLLADVWIISYEMLLYFCLVLTPILMYQILQAWDLGAYMTLQLPI